MVLTPRSPVAHRWPGIDAIPHPPYRMPLVGDVLGISSHRTVQDSLRMARRLGPIFRRRFFGLEVVLVTGADLVAELSDETRFDKRVVMAVRNLRESAGDGLFTAHRDEPNWRLAHDILAPGFTREAMRRYHPAMLEVTHRLIAAWDRHAATGTPVDVSGDMTRLTLETIGRTGFGYDFGSFDRSDPHPFVAAMVGTLRHAQGRHRGVPVVGPLLTRIADRRNRAHVDLLNSTVDAVVAERRARPDRGPDDLLALMLDTGHPETGARLDATNIRKQIITFLVAGHETTSGALSFALYYLSRHPEVMARAQEEVDRVWGSASDPDYTRVSKLRYVRRVVDEALRLWPTAPGFVRAARQDTVLAGRYEMRRGAWALVLIPGLHRDPVWGEEPDAFDPDRFLPERVRARPAHAFKPFGTGERACIGRQFALHEAVLVLGMLLRRYHLRGRADYHLSISERLTLMPEGLTLVPQRRRVPKPAGHPD